LPSSSSWGIAWMNIHSGPVLAILLTPCSEILTKGQIVQSVEVWVL
jgi:hypothetical protein